MSYLTQLKNIVGLNGGGHGKNRTRKAIIQVKKNAPKPKVNSPLIFLSAQNSPDFYTAKITPTTNKSPFRSNKSVITPSPKKIYRSVKSKKCKNGKERIVPSGRCIKKCNENYTRRENGKCYKNKTQKQTSPKKCPAGKELNVLTGRCINKCKPTYTRRENGKCYKNK